MNDHRVTNALPALWVDFNTQDLTTIPLDGLGTKRDIQAQAVHLLEGMNVVLYMNDSDERGADGYLHVSAKVKWDASAQRWIGDFSESRFDWTARSDFDRIYPCRAHRG
jgi:hypothetical protein